LGVVIQVSVSSPGFLQEVNNGGWLHECRWVSGAGVVFRLDPA